MRFLRSNLIQLIAFGFIAFIYLYQLDNKSLWLDEGYSLYDASHLIGFNVNVRPVYYLTLRGWMTFGESVYWLRLLSVIFALLSLYQTLKLGIALKLPTSTRYLAVVMMALSPNFLKHSQEIRMYPLGIFLTLLGSIILLNLIEKPKLLFWLLWALFRILAFLTIPLSATLIVSDILIIFSAFKKQKKELKKLLITLAVIIFICLPFAYGLIYASHWFMSGWVKNRLKPDIVIYLRMLFEYLTVSKVTLDNKNSILRFIFIGCMIGLCIAPVLNKNERKYKLYLMCWCLVPTFILAIISHIKSTLWIERYLIFILPYLFLLLASGIEVIFRHTKLCATIFLTVYLYLAGSGIVRLQKPREQSWREMAARIDNLVKPGDIVLSPHSERAFYCLKYYLKSPWEIYFHEIKSISKTNFLNYLQRSYENPYKEPHGLNDVIRTRPFSEILKSKALETKGKVWLLFSQKVKDSSDQLELQYIIPSDAIDPRSPIEKCNNKDLESSSLFCKIALWDRKF